MPGFAPLVIGLALTLIHLISIPVTNTSVNPARSTGVALYAGSWAIGQLWLFWVAPILGGALGGLGYRALCDTTRASGSEPAFEAEADWSARRTSPRGRTGSQHHSCSRTYR